MAAPGPCHCEHCNDRYQAGWYDGYSEATFDAAHSLAKAGMFELQDTAQKLISEAHLVTHQPDPAPTVKRWSE